MSSSRSRWQARFAAMPKGLTPKQASAHLGLSIQHVRLLGARFAYPFGDGRKNGARLRWEGRRILVPERVNWRLPNVVIARSLGISRERVRQVRQRWSTGSVQRVKDSPACKP